MKKINVIKKGDLLVQTNLVSEDESKFIIVTETLPDLIIHWHINKDIKNISKAKGKAQGNICPISNVRKPYKQELTEEVMKQYKKALTKLILKEVI